MQPHGPHSGYQRRVSADDHTALTARHRLSGVETEDHGVAPPETDRNTFGIDRVGVGGILDHS
jgi:hypothetical protein